MASKFLNNNGVDLSALQDGTFSIFAKSIKVNDLDPNMNVSADNNKFLNSTSSGSGDMTYVGTTPATDYILKAASDDGLTVSKSSISETSGIVTMTQLHCDTFKGSGPGSAIYFGSDTNTVRFYCDTGIQANKFTKTGGTNQQYLMADGSVLAASAQNGNANFYLYNNINGLSAPPPANGKVSYNAATLATTTFVYISHLTRDSVDIDIYFALINTLDDLYIQDQSNSVNFAKFNITGAPILNLNNYITIPVAQVQFGGNGNTAFGVNHDILISFFSNLQEINTRITAIETKTQNQSATALLTTFVPGTTLVCETLQPNEIKCSDINTLYLNGTMSIGQSLTGNMILGRATKNMTIHSDLLTTNVINSTSSYAPDVYSDNTWADKVDPNTVYPLNIGTGNATTITIGRTGQNTIVNSDNLKVENLNTNRINNALSILPMTSNILPSGYIASSSGNYTIGTDAWNAFSQTAPYFQSTLVNYNGASGIYTGSNTTLITGLGSTLGDWLQIQLPSVINVASYTLDGANGTTQRNPSTFYFLYSLDNINWIIANTQTAYQWVSPYLATFTLATPVLAKYFRISVSLTGNTGVVVNRNCIQVNELTLNQPLGTIQVPTLLSNKTTFSDANELVTKAYVATILQGMPFNSIYGNTTTAPTGIRSLWYTAIAPYATLINGITNIYVDGGGSDTCHFGIYRGYLKAGAVTNPGLNITLVGQSTASLSLTTGLPFNRVHITAVSGQNLNFTSGEYITIAFHTSGISNTFLSSPTAGSSFTNLCFTTTSNHATTTFPATVTNSAISSASTQRLCFDLY